MEKVGKIVGSQPLFERERERDDMGEEEMGLFWSERERFAIRVGAVSIGS